MLEVPNAEEAQMREQPKADTHEWNWKRTARNAVLVGVLAFAPRSDAGPPIPVIENGSGVLNAPSYEIQPQEGHVVVVYGPNPPKVDGEGIKSDLKGLAHEVVFGCGTVDFFTETNATIHPPSEGSRFYTTTVTTPHPEKQAKKDLLREGCPDPDIRVHK